MTGAVRFHSLGCNSLGLRCLILLLLFLPPAAAPAAPAGPGEPGGDGQRREAGATAGLDLPFSEAVRVGDLLFLSGMIGNRPGAMELVPGGIEAETRQTLEKVRDTLERHGSSLDEVVKCTVMLADIGEWPRMNAVYRTFFRPPYPARSAFGASGLALGARVEIECIAAVGKGRAAGAAAAEQEEGEGGEPR